MAWLRLSGSPGLLRRTQGSPRAACITRSWCGVVWWGASGQHPSLLPGNTPRGLLLTLLPLSPCCSCRYQTASKTTWFEDHVSLFSLNDQSSQLTSWCLNKIANDYPVGQAP